MRAYKGFDLAADGTISCRDHQYTVGETYVHDGPIELCKAGYHACPIPLDTLRYYPPSSSVYHEVDVDDDAQGDGTKVVSGRITVGARLSLADMIAAHLDLAQDRARRKDLPAATSGYWSTAATSGDGATAATSGDGATAATSGDGSTAATSGDGSTAATSGDGATAATSGYWSTAATSGYESIAVAGGYQCRARGALGCWLVLAERDHTGHILGVQAVPVDGETIRADTLYMLRGGQVVEVES